MNENKNKNNNQRYILTRETLGMTILLFCFIMLIMLLTRSVVFSSVGVAVCTFMYGTFGYGSFLVLAALAYLGEWLVWEKSIKISPKCALIVALCILLGFLVFHSVSARNIPLESYGSFISLCYNNAANGLSGYTFGGALSAILVYPIAKLTTFVGAYIIFGVLFAGSLYLSVVFIRDEIIKAKKGKPAKMSVFEKKRAPVQLEINENEQEEEPQPQQPQPVVSYADPYGVTENYEIVDNVPRPVYTNPAAEAQDDSDRFSRENLGKKILFENGEFAAESYRRNMIFSESSYFNHPVHNDDDYMSSFGAKPKSKPQESSPTYGESYREAVDNGTSAAPSSYVYGDKPVESLDDPPLTEGVYREDETLVQDDDSYINYGVGDEETIDQPPEPIEEQPYQRSEPPLFARRTEENAQQEPPERNDYNERISPILEGRDDIIRSENIDEEPPVRRGVEETPPARMDGEEIIRRDSQSEEPAQDIPVRRERDDSDGGRSTNGLFGLFSSDNPNLGGGSIEPDASRIDRSRRSSDSNELFGGRREVSDSEDENKANLFDDEEEEGEDVFEAPATDETPELPARDASGRDQEPVIPERNREMVHITPPTRESVEPEIAPEPPKPKHVWKKYVAPGLDLLQNYSETGSTNAAEIEENKIAIVETLANIRIESEIINVIVGSKFTRYDVRIKDNTAIKTALKHKDDIQIALRKDTINAYINFKLAALSIEVPNRESGTVGLKGMLASSQFLNSKPNSLTFALGKNIEGDCICPDITKMPHLLVAGTTGSGKSICLSSLIVSLLYKYGPSELRFILVDPKQVEFIPYENLPHLMINEIIFDVDKAIKALNWAIKEMERRYKLFKDMTASGLATKDLTEYNANLPEGEEKLPKIVIILDEFGDLMLQAKKEIETRIVRLVQKARACGIHLILATQRPSVDCITGLIKSNLPTRIGFKVNSFDDSRTIFDIGGAEKLLGSGDMYFRRPDRPELQRVQGCFISSTEVQKVTDFVKEHNETYFDDSVSEFINQVDETEDNSVGISDEGASDQDAKIDDTFIKALKFCVTSNQASVSMIQRRFPVGYIKACKIIDWMENMNYITQSEGSKPRKVLLSREEFTNIYGDIDD